MNGKRGWNGRTWLIHTEICYVDFQTENTRREDIFWLHCYHIKTYFFVNVFCERNTRAFSVLIDCVFIAFLTTKNFHSKHERTYRKILWNRFCRQVIRSAYITANGGRENGVAQRRVIIYNVLNMFNNNSICIIHIIHTHRVVPGGVRWIKLNNLFVFILHTHIHTYTCIHPHTYTVCTGIA